MAKNFYSKHAGPQLKSLLKELDTTKEERFDLAQEVDMIRIAGQKAAIAFEQICVIGVLDTKDEDTGVTTPNIVARAQATQLVKDSMREVGNIVAQMAKVEVLTKEKISVANIKWICDRICRIINEYVGTDNPELSERIVQAIKDIRTEGQTGPTVVLEVD